MPLGDVVRVLSEENRVQQQGTSLHEMLEASHIKLDFQFIVLAGKVVVLKKKT